MPLRACFKNLVRKRTGRAAEIVHQQFIINLVYICRSAFALENADQPQDHLPFFRTVLLLREYRVAVPRMVAIRKLRERYIVMRIFQRRCSRQNHIGMARGFVQVNIQAHHEFQLLHCGTKTLAVRR